MRYPKRDEQTKRTGQHSPGGVSARSSVDSVLIEEIEVGGGNHEE